MYPPVLVTAPAIMPVDLMAAKAQCRVDASDEDALITGLVAAAVSHLDGWTGILGRCLITQTWRQDFDGFHRCLRLPLAPVSAVTNVKYDDTADVEQTVNSSSYDLLEDSLGAYVRFKDGFPFPNVHEDAPAVRVTYVAGYADADAVPAAIRHAILMLVGHWYENREAIVTGTIATSLPFAVDALLAPWRRVRF